MIPTEDNHGPIPVHLRDDGIPLGNVTYGHNLVGEKGIMVVRKVNTSPRCAVAYRYEVVLKVDHMWQAQAIAAILSAK